MFDLVMVLSKIGDWTMSKLVIFPFLALCISCVKANVKAHAGPGQKTIFADYSVISLLFRSFFLWLLKRKKEKEKKKRIWFLFGMNILFWEWGGSWVFFEGLNFITHRYECHSASPSLIQL